MLALGAASFTHQRRQGCLEGRHASAMNHLARQAVPDPSESEYRPLQQCWVRPWPLLLQLAIVLVNGPPRAVAMFDRRGWLEEGRQIFMSLAKYAAKNQAKHRNISTDTQRCKIMTQKSLAPGKAELPNERLLRIVERLPD